MDDVMAIVVVVATVCRVKSKVIILGANTIKWIINQDNIYIDNYTITQAYSS